MQYVLQYGIRVIVPYLNRLIDLTNSLDFSPENETYSWYLLTLKTIKVNASRNVSTKDWSKLNVFYNWETYDTITLKQNHKCDTVLPWCYYFCFLNVLNFRNMAIQNQLWSSFSTTTFTFEWFWFRRAVFEYEKYVPTPRWSESLDTFLSPCQVK